MYRIVHITKNKSEYYIQKRGIFKIWYYLMEDDLDDNAFLLFSYISMFASIFFGGIVLLMHGTNYPFLLYIMLGMFFVGVAFYLIYLKLSKMLFNTEKEADEYIEKLKNETQQSKIIKIQKKAQKKIKESREIIHDKKTIRKMKLNKLNKLKNV